MSVPSSGQTSPRWPRPFASAGVADETALVRTPKSEDAEPGKRAEGGREEEEEVLLARTTDRNCLKGQSGGAAERVLAPSSSPNLKDNKTTSTCLRSCCLGALRGLGCSYKTTLC